MLEDLCLDAVADDPAMPCVSDFFRCLADTGQQPAKKDMAKARLHAWLASRERPDLRLGEAARKGVLPWDTPALQPMRRFLLDL